MSTPELMSKSIRKRKNENQNAFTSSETLTDDIQNKECALSKVVESTIVCQYLHKINAEGSDNNSSCIKLIVCDSEAQILSSGTQDRLREEFKLESIGISESCLLNVDRIVTLHGKCNNISRCAIFISFMICSRASFIFGSESFTLRSMNYKLNVAIEADDISIFTTKNTFAHTITDVSKYEQNPGLHLAKLRGDFVTLFRTLNSLFSNSSYEKFASDDDIKFLNIIMPHDNNYFPSRSSGMRYPTYGTNAALKNFIYVRGQVDEF